MHTLYFVGTAGSGKSALTHAFASWLKNANVSVGTVNLDPGVLHLPYGPDIDVRDFVSLQGIMEKYNLGPNGGLIAAIDLISTHLESLQEEITDLGVDFLLMDTPGQIELFAFRETGPIIVSSLGGESKMLVYLVDAALGKTPAGLVSSLLLSASVLVRFHLSQVNILSRVDLLSEEELEKVNSWLDDSTQLLHDLQESRNELQIELSGELFNSIQRLFSGLDVVPVSAARVETLELLFSHVSNTLTGGEGFEIFR
ncbi:MAG: ATP/GTP-binding protein [Candidatus Hermodarchaeia archaeon]